MTKNNDSTLDNHDDDYQNTCFSPHDDLEIMSPEIENSYIQQNLPIRRQSLIVYHDKLRADSDTNQDEQPPKRHTSLNFTCFYNAEKPDSRIYSSKSLSAIYELSPANQPQGRKNLTKKPHLSIQITRSGAHGAPSISTINSSASSSNSSTCSAYELSMDTLFEEDRHQLDQQQQPQQQPKQQTIPRFIGLLRPSKSDTIGAYNSKHSNERREKHVTTDDINSSNPASSPLSQSWNDMAQPLYRLRNAFSRLQTSSAGSSTSGRSKRMSSQNNDMKNRKKKPPSVKTDIISSSSRYRKKKSTAITYTALLSHVSNDFLRKIQVTTIALKDGIQYYDVFNGTEAVSCILEILNTSDRNLALLVGRSLESQGLFHHVNYDYRLRDLESELYQFQYLQQENTPIYGGRPPIPPQYSSSPIVPNKLLYLKKPNRRHVPSVCETLPVNGVFSVLTDCYSPTCTRKSSCYSISCPRMMTQKKKSAQRPLSSHFLRTEQEKQLRSLWRHSVPRNIVLGTNNMEQRRQECIYELIYTEEDFVKDMHYIQDFWIEPLLANDIIPLERRTEFITDVFWNLADIERISTALAKDLTLRQDKHTVIPCIGDIMLRHVEGFDPFVSYGAHQIVGKHKYELEKKRNTKFLQFAENLERQPESRRLELNGYLTKPTSRLGRYNLLLNAIHQVTPKDHQDDEDIPIVMDKITEFLVRLNKEAGMSDNSFHLEQIFSRILASKGQSLELLDPKRQLLMRGKMKRCTQNASKSTHGAPSPVIECTSVDIQLFLFDHYLVFCKIKHQDGLDYYKIYQKPIPLKSLSAFIPDSVIIPSPTTITATKSNIYTKLSSSTFHNTIPDTSANQSNNTSIAKYCPYPITFQNNSDDTPLPSITLIASTESTRKLWLNKITEYQKKFCQDNSSIEEKSTVSDT